MYFAVSFQRMCSAQSVPPVCSKAFIGPKSLIDRSFFGSFRLPLCNDVFSLSRRSLLHLWRFATPVQLKKSLACLLESKPSFALKEQTYEKHWLRAAFHLIVVYSHGANCVHGVQVYRDLSCCSMLSFTSIVGYQHAALPFLIRLIFQKWHVIGNNCGYRKSLRLE